MVCRRRRPSGRPWMGRSSAIACSDKTICRRTV